MSTATIESLRAPRPAAEQPNVRLDMFSSQGFSLAQRVAQAYASSDAVPAQFRLYNLKKSGSTEQWVENPAAIGNCLVAIEVAQAIGMSVVMVMQNADPIQGKLRWNSKFQIAAVNASRRFSPLRFDFQNLGRIKAKYKEKTGWDKAANKPIYAEREVEVENIQCIAWAVPHGTVIPAGVGTLAQAKQAGMAVIEGAPVSMKMAVEEGWYGKTDSKWQGEMKTLMLQYRAGTFFAGIHAPDVVMGMGMSSEEAHDVIDATRQSDGSFAVNLGDLQEAAKAADVSDAQPADDKPADKPAGAAQAEPETATGPTLADVLAMVESGDLDAALDAANSLPNDEKRKAKDAIRAKARPAEAQSSLSME
jgi:hypothetical protein